MSFWPILTPWWGNQIFPEKKPSTKCYLHWYVTSCKKLEKINEWFLTYSQENGKKGHFGPWWGNQIFPTKKPWTKFYPYGYVTSYKKSEKINAWFSRYSQLNGQKGHFGPFLGPLWSNQIFPAEEALNKILFPSGCNSMQKIRKHY